MKYDKAQYSAGQYNTKQYKIVASLKELNKQSVDVNEKNVI